jgi:hypothetical protein
MKILTSGQCFVSFSARTQLQPAFYGPWAEERQPGTSVGNSSINSSTDDSHVRHRKATLVGLTRYSVFEQPRLADDMTPGSVTVSLVADEGGYGSIFGQIDSMIDRWEERL